MRFDGERQMSAPVGVVWASLHDPEVLRRVIPGCSQMTPLGEGSYSATMEARVGRIADTYRGRFGIADVAAGSELRVRMAASGRCGRIELDLYVRLLPGRTPGTTSLRYDAEATVGGLVKRLGSAALSVTGGHFTNGFFRELDRSLRSVRRGVLATTG